MNRSPPSKEETNSSSVTHPRDDDIKKGCPSSRGRRRRLVDYTKQRGEGERHEQPKRAIGTGSRPSSLRHLLLHPGVPAEIVIGSSDAQELSPRNAKNNEKEQSEDEMIDFFVKVPPSPLNQKPRAAQAILSLKSLSDPNKAPLATQFAGPGNSTIPLDKPTKGRDGREKRA